MQSDTASAHDELVEKMARAIAKTQDDDWDNPSLFIVDANDDAESCREAYRDMARAALAVARPMIREECAKVAEADAKKSGWLVAAQLGLTEDEQKQFNQNAAKALEIAAAIRAMD
jgi:hypothetical protein